MAKLKTVPAAPTAAPTAAAAAPVSGKKAKILLFAGIGAIVIAAASGGIWFGLHQQQPAGAPEHKQVEAKGPIFMTLDPFTVNLLQEAGDHYLQAGIVYQVDSEKTAETMKTYMPIIRNHILLLLSAKKPVDLANVEGKQKLAAELVSVVRESLPQGALRENAISGAYLSSFVIQ